MAVVEETIGTGQDRATVTLWEANVGVFGTDTYKGIISTNDEFNENPDLIGSTGTPSITSYLWLTTDPANRHGGVAGTGHGRKRGSSTGRVIGIAANLTRMDWLENQQDSTTAAAEAILIGGTAGDVLIDYCIVWSDQTAANQDGIYTGNASHANLRISNCILYGWSRAGIHFELFSGTPTVTADIDHCAIYDCGSDDADDIGAVKVGSAAAGDTITVGIFNTWGDISVSSASKEAFADGDVDDRVVPPGTVVWNGSHNLATEFSTHDEIDGTDNITNWQDATSSPFVEDTTQASGSYVVVTSKTGGSENLLLLDDAAGNLAAGNGTDRQGSEPDARQDFSVDITGAARPTSGVDIGPHQVVTTAISYFIRANLVSRKVLRKDADRLVSQDLMSNRKST